MCKNNHQEEEGGVSLEKDEVQGCFDGRIEEAKGKTISGVPMRMVGDIFLGDASASQLLGQSVGNNVKECDIFVFRRSL